MTNKEFIEQLLGSDPRKAEIMKKLEKTSFGCGKSPMDMELCPTYKQMWETFTPDILADETNEVYHIVHSFVHDLTNIKYCSVKEKNCTHDCNL